MSETNNLAYELLSFLSIPLFPYHYFYTTLSIVLFPPSTFYTFGGFFSADFLFFILSLWPVVCSSFLLLFSISCSALFLISFSPSNITANWDVECILFLKKGEACMIYCLLLHQTFNNCCESWSNFMEGRFQKWYFDFNFIKTD